MAINIDTMCRALDELIEDVQGNSDWDFYWKIRHQFREYLGKDVELNCYHTMPRHEDKGS